MYHEPIVDEKTNAAMRRQIEAKTQNVVTELTTANLGDEDFNAKLLDLCVLNRMADSHDKAEATKL